MKWRLKHEIHGDKPWDVQAEAMDRSEGHTRYGYFLQQGLGKTALTLNDFVNSDADLNVVLAPQSFKGDWTLAPEEWGQPDIGWAMWPKPPLKTDKSLYIMNYEAVRSSGKETVARLMRERRVFFTIDESSAIKNPQSLTAKAVIELARGAVALRELNGTPLVKNVMDLYPQLRVLGQLNGMNPFAFRNRYATMGGYMGKMVTGIREDTEDELYEIMDRCSFRALTADWRDMPLKIYKTVELDMTASQRSHYHEMLEDFLTVVDGNEYNAPMVLTQMDKLRQISSCLIMNGDQHSWIEEPKNNPKLRAAKDIIEGGSNKATLVHVYRASGDMLFNEMEKLGYKPARIAGGMSTPDLLYEKRRFERDSDCRVLIGQEQATARGHTLIGREGTDRNTRMIFYENDFSLLYRLQIEDRNMRGLMDQDCVYYDLSTSPIDAAVCSILQEKKQLADRLDSVVKVARGFAKALRPSRVRQLQ